MSWIRASCCCKMLNIAVLHIVAPWKLLGTSALAGLLRVRRSAAGWTARIDFMMLDASSTDKDQL